MVALHPEGVDRNHRLPKVARVVLVALHPEGVDRNPMGVDAGYVARLSPSTRRAWIEIARCWFGGLWRFVALHPEGVDRNLNIAHGLEYDLDVALHPEGVDRNQYSQ